MLAILETGNVYGDTGDHKSDEEEAVEDKYPEHTDSENRLEKFFTAKLK